MNELEDELYNDLPHITVLLGASLIAVGCVTGIINSHTLTTLSAVGIVVMVGVGGILMAVGLRYGSRRTNNEL